MENIVNFRIARDERQQHNNPPPKAHPARILEQELETIRQASEQLRAGMEAERKKKESYEAMVGDIQGQYEGILHSAHREKIKLTAERNTLEDSLKVEKRRTREVELTLDNLSTQVQALKEELTKTRSMVASENVERQALKSELSNEIKSLKDRLLKETLATREQTATEIYRLDESAKRQQAHTSALEANLSKLAGSIGHMLSKQTQSILNTVKNWTVSLDEKWELRLSRRMHEAFHELTNAVKTQIEQEVKNKQNDFESQFSDFEKKLEREVSVLFGNQNLIQNGFNHLVTSLAPTTKPADTPKHSRFSHAEDIPVHRRSQEYIEERLARLRQEDGEPPVKPQPKQAPLPEIPPKVETAQEEQPKRVVTPPPFRGKKKGSPPLPIPPRPHWES